MSEYFPKPKSLGANVRVESNLSSYATKQILKNWYIRFCWKDWFSWFIIWGR